MTIGDELTKKGLSIQKFVSGEVWTLKDDVVSFPGRNPDNVEPWKKRRVIVMQNERDNQDGRYITVTVIPVTTRLDGETPQCLVPEAGEPGIDERSLAKVGFIQPVLKNHLHNKLGTLHEVRIEEIRAKLAANLGLLE